MKKTTSGRSKGSKEFGRQLKRARGADPSLYNENFMLEDMWLSVQLQMSDRYPNSKRMQKRFRMLEAWIEDPTVQARRARSRGLKTVSIRKMAELMGISKNTLLDYENGVRYPPIEFVFDFCDARGIQPDDLVTGWITNHPNPNVQKQKNLGYVNNFFLDQKENIRGGKKYNSIRFITAAIRAGVWYAEANVLSEEKAGQVAVVAAYLMQSALSNGRELHPDSILFEIEDVDDLLSEEYLKYLYASFQFARYKPSPSYTYGKYTTGVRTTWFE